MVDAIHVKKIHRVVFLLWWGMSQNQGDEKIVDFRVHKQSIYMMVPIFVETRSFGSSHCYPTDCFWYDALQLFTAMMDKNPAPRQTVQVHSNL